ncbi:MAG: DinB family protein, partial [Terriglobales bacterium]
NMPIGDLLLVEFDEEMKKTRTMLERVPEDKKDFAPHPRSMPLNKLAPHIAQLASFGLTILTTPELDFSKSSFKPLPFESAAQLVTAFDEGAAKARAALKNTPDEAWTQPWKLSFGGKPIFSGSRFLAYRQMFLNHVVHHRAQLGVYLRMNEKPVPSTYGPSADDTMGF